MLDDVSSINQLLQRTAWIMRVTTWFGCGMWQVVGSEEYNELAKLKVNWHFIPSAAPHQGGYWESAGGEEWKTLLAQRIWTI